MNSFSCKPWQSEVKKWQRWAELCSLLILVFDVPIDRAQPTGRK